jgi:hypothetical protein
MSLGRGRKTREWEKIRRELKIRFERVGIISCEIRLKQCWGGYALSFAHTKKRADMLPGDIEIAVLACAPCHTAVEGMKKDAMQSLLESIILERSVQP